MPPSEEQLRILRAVGARGATRDLIGADAESQALKTLVEVGYIRFVPMPPPPAAGADAWYLTYDGAEAIGIDPDTLAAP